MNQREPVATTPTPPSTKNQAAEPLLVSLSGTQSSKGFAGTTHASRGLVAHTMNFSYAVARQYGRCARDAVERVSRRRPLSSSSLTSSIDSNHEHGNGRQQEPSAGGRDAIGEGGRMRGLSKAERAGLDKMRRGPASSADARQHTLVRELRGK